MKYIIDIPEEYYKVITDIPNRQCTVDMLIIKNGTPLEDIKEQYNKGYNDGVKETFIEELEKIKAEIEEIKGDELPYNASDYLYGRYQAFDIVDDILQDRIAELKGENNAE